MGCHTIFKTRSKYTIEQLRKIWIARQKEWIAQWEAYTNNPDHPYRRGIDPLYGYPQKEFDFKLEVYKRELRMVENGSIKYAFIRQIVDTGETSYECINKVIYCDNGSMPRDLFRAYGYPENQLFSLAETLAFLDDPKNECIEGHNAREKLADFWKKFPESVIRFG